MKPFSTILAFVYCVVGVLSVDKCAWGPTYWCSSIKSAKECNAVKHCTATVWANTKVKSDDGELCKWCTELVEKARQMVSDKANQDEILHLLEQGCASIPVSEEFNECHALAQEYNLVVYDYLVNQMDSKRICYLIQFCKSQIGKVDSLTATLQSLPLKRRSIVLTKRAEVQCLLCDFIVGQLDQMLADNKTEEAIKEALDKVCNPLPKTIAQQCNEFIDQYAEGLLVLLAQELDPDLVCTALGLCTSRKK